MQQPRIATWRAVSTEDQAEKESLDYQDRLNKEHAARWNGVIVAELEVPGVSRNIVLWEDACRAIPAYAQLDALIKRKAIDILMCLDASRLGRHRALIVNTASLCEQAGIRIYETFSPPVSIDGPHSTADSRLLMMFKGFQSEEEVRKTAERSVFGRQAQVRKGKHISNVPLGLKRIYDELGESHTIIDEEWRPMIELFYDLYVNHGRTQYQIAEEFNARGLLMPDGRLWNRDSIRAFLRNRWTYAGFAVWGERSKIPDKAFRVAAEWPAVISEEMARAAERGARERAERPKAAGRPARFSMMLRCKQCGETMHAHTYRTSATSLRMGYICRFRCKRSFIREVFIAEAVEQAVIYLQDHTRLEALVGETPEEYAGYEELLIETKKALDGVERERKRLTQAFMREAIDIGEYEPLMAELKARHIAIAANITQLEDQIAETPTAERRRQRLQEIRDRGMTMLMEPDILTANAWLRQHFILYIDNNSVKQLHYY